MPSADRSVAEAARLDDALPAPRRLLPATARRWILGAMGWLFGGGILAHSWPLLRPLALALTTPLLILTNAAVLLAVFDDHRTRRLRWWCLGAWAVTVALEMVGVATGRVFGAYAYGPTLRGQIAGVPLLIGLNWTVLLLGALSLVSRFWFFVFGSSAQTQQSGSNESPFWGENDDVRKSWINQKPETRNQKLLTAFAAAALLTAFDGVMEPVAVSLNYWAWASWPLIPTQNYVAWFGIALALGWSFTALGLTVRTHLAQYYFGLQLAFFVALRLLLGS